MITGNRYKWILEKGRQHGPEIQKRLHDVFKNEKMIPNAPGNGNRAFKKLAEARRRRSDD